VDTGAGPWLRTSLAALAGSDERVVVLGAALDAARALVPPEVRIVVNPDPATGMGASLRLGLAALAGPADAAPVDVALVHLVDLPDVGAPVVARLLVHVRSLPAPRSALVRAGYHGVPGHPVALGAEHWPGAAAAATGDRGARDHLGGRVPGLVECGDLATGRDVDVPAG
jgi:CTP:molybdopterin cytidylyltransferase MocA